MERFVTLVFCPSRARPSVQDSIFIQSKEMANIHRELVAEMASWQEDEEKLTHAGYFFSCCQKKRSKKSSRGMRWRTTCLDSLDLHHTA